MLRLVVACVAAVMLAPPGIARGQDWREAGLAAFDLAWRTVSETYYDPTFGGVDWNAVRAELRPRAEAAASPDAQRAVIREMLARLRQSHFTLLSSAPSADDLAGPAGVPFDVRVAPGGLLVTALHAGAPDDVQPGDRIERIDGLDVAPLAGDAALDRSAAYASWRRAMAALSGQPGTSVAVTVRSPDAPASRDITLRRVLPPGDLVTVGNLPTVRARLDAFERTTSSGRRVGIVAFNIWMASLAEPFARAVDRFRAHDAIVIDLRGNPGGLADMIRGVAGHFIDEPVLLGRMRMRAADLEFRVNPRRSTSDGRSVTPYAGPVAVLVDGLTASASECFVGAMQGLGRVRVFGTTTMGQALPASTSTLPTGDVLLHVVGDFVTADGRRLEGIGVTPDEEVPLDARALAGGRDALRAAMDWIDSLPHPETARPR